MPDQTFLAPPDAASISADTSSSSVETKASPPSRDAGLSGALRGLVSSNQRGLDQVEKSASDIYALKPPLPPKLEKPPNPQNTPPMEAFGSAAMALAGLGSLLTRRPLTNALNAGAAVMKAVHENDIESAQKAYKQWEIDTKYAVELHQFQQEAYQNAIDKGKTNIEMSKALMTAHAAAFNDQVMLTFLNRGDMQGALAIHQGRDPYAPRITEGMLRMKDDLEKRSDVARVEAIQDPTAKAQAKNEVDQKWLFRDNIGKPGKVPSETEARLQRVAFTDLANELGRAPVLSDPADRDLYDRKIIDVEKSAKATTAGAVAGARAAATPKGQEMADLNARAVAQYKEEHGFDPKDNFDPELIKIRGEMKRQDVFDKAKTQFDARLNAHKDPLDKETADMQARLYLLTGSMTSMGMGNAAARTQIITVAKDIAKAEGHTPEDYITKRATLKVDTKVLGNLTERLENTRASEGAANYHIGNILRLMDEGAGTPTGSVFNRYAQFVRGEIAGSPAVLAFQSQVREFTGEYAKIISGGVGSVAAATDGAREEAQRMVDVNQNPEAIKAQLAVAKLSMAQRLNAYIETTNSVRQSLGGIDTGRNTPVDLRKAVAGEPAAQAPAGPGVSRPTGPATPRRAELKGRTIEVRNGKWVYVDTGEEAK